MSDTEIAIVKTHLENIREDISELKESHKKISEFLSKLIFFEDKFKANDESHRIFWDKVNKMNDRVAEHDKTASVVSKWEKRIDKIMVSVAVIGLAQLAAFIVYLLRKV